MKSSLKKLVSLMLVVVMIITTNNFNSFSLTLDTLVRNEIEINKERNKNNNTKYYEEFLSEKKQYLLNDEGNASKATTKNNDIDKTVKDYLVDGNMDNINKDIESYIENNKSSNDTDNGNQVNDVDENENITSNEDNTINNKINDAANKSTKNVENKNDVQVDVVEDDIIDNDIDSVVSDAIAVNDTSNLNNNDGELKNDIEQIEISISTDSDMDIYSESQVFGVGVDNLQFKIGDYIKFGRYEQDNDLTNGKELIQWIIVDIDTKKKEVFLFPTKALDYVHYHTENIRGLTYKDASIRKFLNNDFYNTAFNEEDKKYIIGRTDICNDEQTDYVWLISSREYNFYQSDYHNPSYSSEVNDAMDVGYSNRELRSVTPYAIQKATNEHKYYGERAAYGCYWLRDTGYGNENGPAYADYVGVYGSNNWSKFTSEMTGFDAPVVRPAIKVKQELLNSQYLRDYYQQFVIGDVIKFGTYEQDNNLNNGKETIKWVLADINKETGEGVFVTRKTLEWIPFVDSNGKGACAYNVSNIRKFLNNDFFDTAFTNEEKRAIIPRTDIGGDGSFDNVYILSSDEYNKYHDTYRLQLVQANTSYFVTKYAIKKYANNYNGSRANKTYDERYLMEYGTYYLRDTGKVAGYDVMTEWSSYYCGVRPVVQVDLTLLGYGINSDNENVKNYKINWQLKGGTFKQEYKHYETDKHNDTEDFILPTEDMLNPPYGKIFKEWLVEGVATTSIAKEIKKDVTVEVNWAKSTGGFESFNIGTYKATIEDTEEEADLDWLILDKKDDKLLLMTKNVIDNVSYDKNGNANFKNSSIKKWLNNDFYEKTFDDKQKRNIFNDKNNGKVFLLTKEQFNEYFATNMQSLAEATEYAGSVNNGGEKLDLRGSLSPYWLMATEGTKVPYVQNDGILNESGIEANAKTIGVRPCIWVEEKKMDEVSVFDVGKFFRGLSDTLKPFFARFFGIIW